MSGGTAEEIEALALDLYGHALRGLVIGVAGLAWHGLGFDPGIPRAKALKVLDYLRDKGPVFGSDLLRGAHITAGERDILLERLAAEDLVRVDGKVIAATPFSEFVGALYARKEYPALTNHWADVVGKGKKKAAV